jgi:exopolysaccharide production protein ExoQ
LNQHKDATMRMKLLNRVIDILAVSLILLLANSRALRFHSLFPATGTIGGTAWREIAVWIVIASLVGLLMQQHSLFKTYLAAWKKNWLLLLFIGLAFLSLAWSVSTAASLYRALVLLFSTLLGAYIGLRYDLRGMLNILFWFGATVVILCYAIALLFSGFGTMLNDPYYGAWNGIFWHRNHMGSIVALLNGIFLIRMIQGIRERRNTAFLDGTFYLFSLLLVYLSRSATGYIIVLGLNFLIALAVGWLTVRARLRPLHYYVSAGVLVVGAILALANINFIFGLFNRSASITGRVPMWNYLIKNIISQHPWLGYGFCALWTMESFRLQVQHAVGWPFPVMSGDNGFMDILLHLGAVGLIVIMVILGYMCFRTGKYGFHHLTIEGFFPLIVIIYALVANISFSLFLETESFVWLLMVVALFLTVGRNDDFQ